MQDPGRWLRATLAALFCVAMFGTAACGSDDDDGESAGGGGSSAEAEVAPKIAWLTPLHTDFIQAEEEGLKSVLEKVGGSYEMFNANFDPQEQLKQCTDAITSSRYNALMIYPVDGTAVRPCIEQAGEADIPVIGMEVPIGPDASKVEPQMEGVVASIVYPGVIDAEERWPLVEEACEEQTGGNETCKIVLSVAFRADPFNAAVLETFQEKAKQGDYEIVQVLETGYDTAQTIDKFPAALRGNPDAHVYIAEADNNAIAAADIIKRANREVLIIGDGGSYQGIEAVKDGTIHSSLGLWPRQMGVAAGEIAIQAVNDQPIERTGINAFEMDEPLLITKETVDQYKPEWGAKAKE